MHVKFSARQLLLFVSALTTAVLIVANLALGSKPSWMLVAVPLSIVATLALVWLEAKSFSFDFLDKPKESENSAAPTNSQLYAGVRVFKSIDDGKDHGWSFHEHIGNLGEKPVFMWAEFDGQKWQYDGLNNSADGAVSEDIRMFGALRYTVCDPHGGALHVVDKHTFETAVGTPEPTQSRPALS